MKKLLLGLGTVVAIVAPVASAVACSNDGSHKTHKTLSFSQSMNKTEFENVLKQYTDYEPKIKAITAGPGTAEEKLDKIHNVYYSMPIFTFTLDDMRMVINMKEMINDPDEGIKEREAFEPKLHELADRLGSTLHFDFS